MASLKNKIQYYLEKNGRISLLELENLCKSEQYKLSNAERRLRELMASNPNIQPEKNLHGAIIGYTIRDGSSMVERSVEARKVIGSTPIRPTTCCYSFLKFKTHDRNCLQPVTNSNKQMSF